jgi:hypothetical protein
LCRVEREEFLNVGIVIFFVKAKFIKVLHSLVEKALSFSAEADVEQIK